MTDGAFTETERERLDAIEPGEFDHLDELLEHVLDGGGARGQPGGPEAPASDGAAEHSGATASEGLGAVLEPEADSDGAAEAEAGAGPPLGFDDLGIDVDDPWHTGRQDDRDGERIIEEP